MDPRQEHILATTRRHFFQQGGLGMGTAALASLVPVASAPTSLGATSQGATAQVPLTGGLPGLPHFAPRAKRAIYLFMAGAPSQMDLFDYKPGLHGLVSTRTCPSPFATGNG